MIKYFSKILAVLLLLIVTSCAEAQDNKEIKKSLDALEQGLINSDHTLFKDQLSANFKLGTYPASLTDEVLPQVLSQYPKLKKLSVVEQKDNKAQVAFDFEGLVEAVSAVHFDSEGKITSIQYIDDVLAASEAAQITSAFSPIDSFTTPFAIEEGIIFVKAILNGKEENFIVDSGAPVMVLNAAHFTNGKVDGQAMGVSGSAATQSIPVEDFNWNGMKISNTEVMGMDLNHLEDATGKKFAGLIGFSMLQDYQLVLDYNKKELTLHHPDVAGPMENKKPTQEIPFVYEAHIPVIKSTIGGKEYKFGLDTGAAANLLNDPDFATLDNSLYRVTGKEDLSGANKGLTEVTTFDLKIAEISGNEFNNMSFVSSDISHLNDGYGLQLNGLLGYPFLASSKVAINFLDTKILFWK